MFKRVYALEGSFQIAENIKKHCNKLSEHEASHPAAARHCRQKAKIAYANVKADAPKHTNHDFVQLTATPRFVCPREGFRPIKAILRLLSRLARGVVRRISS